MINLPFRLQTLAIAPLAPNPWMVLPFALLLAAVALIPFIDRRWWERHYPKVSVTLGGASAIYYLFWLKNYSRLLLVLYEYGGFLALVGSLYVITGGIHVSVRDRARPWANTLLLLTGALLANVIGTTGASMLLIRPFLRMNAARAAPFHVVFFIFIVSNIGGCLTPIGDPPLFLGFLKGVPFWWVLEHCWKPWLLATSTLLIVFYIFDRRHFGAIERAAEPAAHGKWRLSGRRNLPLLAIAVGAVFVSGPPGVREGIMISAAVASYAITSRRIYKSNDFQFEPILEVAWLFIGIFLTMIPVLDFLAARAPTLGIDTEGQFFWLTGALSGVLDNTPTYLAFLATAMGNRHLSIDEFADVSTFLTNHGGDLSAISVGAVFFGAVTYLGNGPNLMVKAISERAGVPTPTMLGYIARYAVPILGPLFLAVATLFFSRWRIF